MHNDIYNQHKGNLWIRENNVINKKAEIKWFTSRVWAELHFGFGTLCAWILYVVFVCLGFGNLWIGVISCLSFVVLGLWVVCSEYLICVLYVCLYVFVLCIVNSMFVVFRFLCLPACLPVACTATQGSTTWTQNRGVFLRVRCDCLPYSTVQFGISTIICWGCHRPVGSRQSCPE